MPFMYQSRNLPLPFMLLWPAVSLDQKESACLGLFFTGYKL